LSYHNPDGDKPPAYASNIACEYLEDRSDAPLYRGVEFMDEHYENQCGLKFLSWWHRSQWGVFVS
jgi:hypothetical protein